MAARLISTALYFVLAAGGAYLVWRHCKKKKKDVIGEGGGVDGKEGEELVSLMDR